MSPRPSFAVDLPGLAGHATGGNVISPDLLSYMTAAGRPLAITITVYYAIKAMVFLLATTVAICTKNKERREACVQIVQSVSRGWPLPRLPGGQGG
jgi:hypothetical protein